MGKQVRKQLIGISFLAVSFSAINAQAATVPFDINMTYSGITTSQQVIFNQAASYWEGVISGYQGTTTPFSLNIAVGLMPTSDGEGGILGGGGPDTTGTIGSYTMALTGGMDYDSADMAQQETSGELYDTVRHEIAHVMGFGTLWGANGLYTDGSYQYTGAAGLAAYQAEFDPTAAFIPVENDGGPGTADGHWEQDSGFLTADLMVGTSTGATNAPVSQATLASFVDLGYTVTPVPLPAAAYLFGTGLLGLVGFRRRKS
ncbi:MAG: VPLPA-CTERM sorting domain-containing protein [Candidatus Thiodiazotropha sp. L084R]